MAGFRILYIPFQSFCPTLANLKTKLLKKKSLVSYMHNWIIQNSINAWILNHTLVFTVSIAARKRFKCKVQCHNKCFEKNSVLSREAGGIALRDTRVSQVSVYFCP